jgi:hypothetical protein
MRKRAILRTFPAALAALLYVLMGVSTAWHAPHFSQGESALHTDRHTGTHELPAVGDCALCAWKTAAQAFTPTKNPVAPILVITEMAAVPRTLAVSGFVAAARARGPPSLS